LARTDEPLSRIAIQVLFLRCRSCAKYDTYWQFEKTVLDPAGLGFHLIQSDTGELRIKKETERDQSSFRTLVAAGDVVREYLKIVKGCVSERWVPATSPTAQTPKAVV